MANPVTGPFVTSTPGQFSSDIKVAYKQARPHSFTLPYTRQIYYSRESWTDLIWQSGPTGPRMQTYSGAMTGTQIGASSFARYGNEKSHATNIAYERLKSKVKEQSGWAENIAQASTSRTMFNNRATQVWDIVKFLSGRGRPRIPPSLKERALIAGQSDKSLFKLRTYKDPASTFLEVEYGWRPLIGDIHSSIKLMCSDPPFGFVKAGAKSAWNENKMERYVNWDGGVVRTVDKKTAIIYVQMGAIFSVLNPNVWLLNSLGVIDPALPWKLLPYSFVVDWFINVEQVIGSISDWFGLTLEQPYTTNFAKTKQAYTYNGLSKSFMGGGLWNSSHVIRNATGVEMSRIQGLIGPTLIIKPFRGFSIERGAQAISLIVAAFGGKPSGNYRV